MSKKNAKQVRILYTNGGKTYVLHSITHTGKDLYHGAPEQEKYSYHESGVLHTKGKDGNYTARNKESPLLVVPFRQLIVAIFHNNDRCFLENGYKIFSGKKAHGTLIIDGRSIPENASFSVDIGVIAPENLAMLYQLLNVHKILPSIKSKAQQVLLYTAVIPWIYAILSHE